MCVCVCMVHIRGFKGLFALYKKHDPPDGDIAYMISLTEVNDCNNIKHSS